MSLSRRLKQGLVDLTVACCLASLVVAAVGIGHGASTYYPSVWASGERNQDYGFEDEFPSGNLRDRVEDGAQDWNPLAGNMQFHRGGVNVTWSYGAACSNRSLGENGVHWNQIDGPAGSGGGKSVWASVRHCFKQNGDLKAIQIQFDREENWHTGTANPPSDKLDAWSVATHEFGHATGWAGHFEPGWEVCTNAPRHTMCPYINYGGDYQRQPEDHDKHTFNAAY